MATELEQVGKALDEGHGTEGSGAADGDGEAEHAAVPACCTTEDALLVDEVGQCRNKGRCHDPVVSPRQSLQNQGSCLSACRRALPQLGLQAESQEPRSPTLSRTQVCVQVMCPLSCLPALQSCVLRLRAAQVCRRHKAHLGSASKGLEDAAAAVPAAP